MGIVKKILLQVLIIMSLSCDNRELIVEMIKKEEFKGVVKSKYIDVQNHYTPFLITTNNQHFSVPLEAYAYINCLDSVIKEKNTFHMKVFENDSLKYIWFDYSRNKNVPLDTNFKTVKYWKKTINNLEN